MAGKTHLNIEKIKELHASGMHPADIAKEMRCGAGSVINQLHSLGLTWCRKTPGKLTDEDRANLIEEYKKGQGATTVGRMFNITKRAVYAILNKAGVGTRSVQSRRRPRKMPKTPRVTPMDIEVKALHEQGLSPPQLAKQLDRYEANIRYSLCKQGLYQVDSPEIKVRQFIKQRSFNVGKGRARIPKDAGLKHDAFESFTEESCYWLGFLCADGCVHTKKEYGQYRIFLNLKSTDETQLLKLKTFLNTSNKITSHSHDAFESSGKPYHSKGLAWTSTRQGTLLQELGIVPHKEGRFVPPSLQNSIPYWRGLVDGDGSVYDPHKGKIYLCGQPAIISAWSTFCENLLGKDCLRIETRPTLQVGSIRHKTDARILIKHLYQNASIYLDRKYQTASKWF